MIPDIFFAILAASSSASPLDFMSSFAASAETFSFLGAATFSGLMGSGGTCVRSRWAASVDMMGSRNVDKSVLNAIK